MYPTNIKILISLANTMKSVLSTLPDAPVQRIKLIHYGINVHILKHAEVWILLTRHLTHRIGGDNNLCGVPPGTPELR